MRNPWFTALSAISFLLLLVALALWVRSWQWVAGTYDGAVVICYAGGADGDQYLHKEIGDEEYESAKTVFHRIYHGPPPGHPAFGAGLHTYAIDSVTYRFDYWWVSLPDWFLALLLSVLPLAWLIGRRRHKASVQAGRCRSCGYDLKGNSSGACPECGTPVRRAAAAAPDTPPAA